VHTAPEELGMHKNYSEAISKGEEKNRTEVDLCKLANAAVAVGPKLKEAYSAYLGEFSVIKQATFESDKFRVQCSGCADHGDFSLKGYDIAAKAIVKLEDSSYRLIFVDTPEKKSALETSCCNVESLKINWSSGNLSKARRD